MLVSYTSCSACKKLCIVGIVGIGIMAMLARTARIPCQDLARTPVLGPRTVEAGEAECLRSSERRRWRA